MQINLNQFDNLSLNDNHIFVIGAPEESWALQDYLASELHLGRNFIIRQYIVERGFNFDELVDLFSAGSLFNDNNCVVLSFKTKPTSEQIKHLIRLYPLLNQQNNLIIKTAKLDKKDLAQEWLQDALVFQLTNSIEESNWLVNYYLAKYELKIENSARQLLIDYTQGNSTQLLQELKQLPILFKAGDSITYSHLVENIMDSSNHTVFNFSSNYLRGNLEQSIKIIDELYQSESDLVLIMWVLVEDITKLIQIKGALKKNQTLRSIAPSLRIWGNALNDFEQANARLSYTVLLEILNRLAKIDYMVKGLIDGSSVMEIKQILKLISKGK